MYVTNKDEVVSILRGKLDEYLVLHKIKDARQTKFRCFVHEDSDPSMVLNPKNNHETAHCFSCGANVDIFTAAELLDNLPATGPGWVTETLPALASKLGVDIALGEPSAHDKVRSELYRLARDIADFIQHPGNTATAYIAERQWKNDYEDCYEVDYSKLIASLQGKGWDLPTIESSRLICIPTDHGVYPLVGKSMVTMIIRDHRARPVAFISRNLDPNATRKYIHSGESLVFQKREVLLGLDRALVDGKKRGLILVEGPGDRFQFLRYGATNVVALCGVALTDMHLNLLKTLGVNTLHFCLDWDEAGQESIKQILTMMATKKVSGFNIFVAKAPTDGSKDPDEFFVRNPLARPPQIEFVDMFDWMMTKVDLSSEDQVQTKIIPVIASAPSAIKRDMLANKLALALGVSQASILHDVERLRNYSYEQRRDRLVASAEKYRAAVEQDPLNVLAAMALHETEIEQIEADYNKDAIGVNYQLSRFDSLQELKANDDMDRSEFNLQVYGEFKKAMAGGVPWTRGALFYFGGRSNSGKTATILALGMDALVNDQDAIVICHFTDDSYGLVEPRLVSNISYILTGQNKLTVGGASFPKKNITSSEESALYHRAVTHMRGLISEERLIILDSEDGNTLSVLEKTVKYARRKYPNKKILCLCDNTHNYSDFSNLDPTSRITRICDAQKRIVNVYNCCMFATAEYRKNMPQDQSKLKLPVNDDLADSRAMMFRAGVIVHVYNDLNDRGDYADTFWTDPFDPDIPRPQLVLLFGKNKLNSFKGKLVVNLDTGPVTLREVDFESARSAADTRSNQGVTAGTLVLETDYEGDDE